MTIRLLLVDDHTVVRIGLRIILEGSSDIEIVGEASTAAEALEASNKFTPDVILMDIGLPDMSGIEATKEIKRLHENIAVVALTIHEDEEYFFKMLDAGASGYVPKRAAPEELLTAIHEAAAGEVYLFPSMAKLLVRDYLNQDRSPQQKDSLDGITDREQEVLTWLAEGDSNNQIALTLTISPKTVARHRENIMRKLNLRSRTELVRYAIRKGIIKL
ncbi:MAG: response regulator transcription factor [Anaerolineae bacterium]|jgi:two-component system response regulator NreC|nr:response regulator transcription factor [Anaerolineae bacterium]MBT6813119.1 response regulator transcription factor [Anaerolineae bacterium]MBT7016228.1 response regulator transcription factor [Anaerolineae bacterium]MBT7601879.1 response regulator transcription factor [Anaerolineae bacterium]MBT7775492.1 response regulator transcription factor [Anaerolineae bacterium]